MSIAKIFSLDFITMKEFNWYGRLCRYNKCVSQLYGIGKGKVVKAIQNDVFLNKLGDIHESFDNVYNECEQFMLVCYGAQKSASMSAARYDLWLSKLSKKTASAAPPLRSLPPTSEAFREHVKRAHINDHSWFCDHLSDATYSYKEKIQIYHRHMMSYPSALILWLSHQALNQLL